MDTVLVHGLTYRSIGYDNLDDMEPIQSLFQATRRPEKNDVVLYIVDGVSTGYESFIYEKRIEEETSEGGWCACAGTKGRWKKLQVPAETMKLVFSTMREFKLIE